MRIVPASLARSVAAAVSAAAVGSKATAGCNAISSAIGSSPRLTLTRSGVVVADVRYSGVLTVSSGAISIGAYAILEALSNADIDLPAYTGNVATTGWVLRVGRVDGSVYVEGGVGPATSTAPFKLTGDLATTKGFAVGSLVLRFDPALDGSTTASWLALLEDSMKANPSLALAGGGTIPFNQPGTRFSSYSGIRAGLLFNGRPTTFADSMNALTIWPWVYAGAGHTATNYAIEIRRLYGQIKRTSTGAWEFIFRGGRARAARWNGGTQVGEFDYQGPDYIRDYTADSSLAQPSGNLGFEVWPAPSVEFPLVGADPAYNGGLLNRPLIADCRNVHMGCQMRVVKRSGADAPSSAIKFLVNVGWDFFWIESGVAPTSRYYHPVTGALTNSPPGWPAHALDAGGGCWRPLRTDGQWQWVTATGGSWGFSDWNGDPWQRPNPWNDSPTYADSWADVAANPPINMIDYYGD